MIPTWDGYQHYKARYPDTFLFFRGLSGYWLFHDQAFIACQVLGFEGTVHYALIGGVMVRALVIEPRHLNSIIAELKLLCFGMRSQVIDGPAQYRLSGGAAPISRAG